MELPEKVAVGDTGPVYQVGHFDDEAGDWSTLGVNYTCSLAVIGTAISRTVSTKTGDSKFFVASLTPVETATLVRGQIYMVCVQINNSTLTPALAKEVQFPIFMTLGGVA
jgi:hypothetical protein